MRAPRTLLDKIWDAHLVTPGVEGCPDLLYVDLHLVHEVTSPQAFAELQARGLGVRRPERTLATMDHSTPTRPTDDAEDGVVGWSDLDPQAGRQLAALADNCATHGIELLGVGNDERGIVHVVGPERGRTWPGMTIVCGDSHTSTHGAFGALAFGIGTTEVSHVLATQVLLQRRPKAMRVSFDGQPPPGTGAKDLILALIRSIGVDGGTGYVLEYRGAAVSALSMEGRMTLCNMSIEAGARAGIVPPDATTVDYLRGRAGVPEAFDAAAARWLQLGSDRDAAFDAEVRIDVSGLAPIITWGINPAQSIPIDGTLPARDSATAAAFDYTGLTPQTPLLDHPIDVVFVGSCTNGRIEDLRDAAAVLRGRRVAEGVRMLVVSGSYAVKRQAEAEALHEVFIAAGAEWREPGCSMCIAMNGDQVPAGQFAVSTSNRNFAGRQGPGSRTFLASPTVAAAAAVAGRVTDPRPYLEADSA